MLRSPFQARAGALRTAFLSAGLVATLGCSLTPLAKRTSAFATAAGQTTRKTSEAYALVDRANYQAQVASLVVHYDSTGFNPDSIHPILSEHALKVRKDLLKGLQQYAELLADISSNRPLTDIDTQAKAIGDSLKSLNADQLSSFKLSTGELNGVTTAVDALGHMLINAKRRRELPGILRDMRQPIQTICELLQQDIGDPQKGGLRNELNVAYTDLIQRQEHYIDDNGKVLSPAEKRTEIRMLPQLAVYRQRADAALAATADALAKLAAAHTALADTASQKDAPAFRIRLTALVDEAGQLDDFYNSLPSK